MLDTPCREKDREKRERDGEKERDREIPSETHSDYGNTYTKREREKWNWNRYIPLRSWSETNKLSLVLFDKTSPKRLHYKKRSPSILDNNNIPQKWVTYRDTGVS